MNWIFSTDRISMREMTPQDAPWFYELNLDPEVMRFTGDVPFQSPEDSKTFLENYDQYKRYGLGRWTLVQKEDGAILGWCGLKYLQETEEVDLGYRVFRKYWNKGFATEASLGSLKYGFEELGLPVIIGRVMKKNPSSIRVMEKIGMDFLGESLCEGHDSYKYQMMKEQWIQPNQKII